MKNLMLELCKVTGSEFDENRFNNTIQRRVSDKKNRQGILLAEDNKKIVGMLLAEVLVSPFIETYGNVVCKEIHNKIFGKSYILRTKDVRDEFEEAGAHLDKCTTVIGMSVMWVAEILMDENYI